MEFVFFINHLLKIEIIEMDKEKFIVFRINEKNSDIRIKNLM